MRKFLWSVFALAAAVAFVVGCSKQLPTQSTAPQQSNSQFSGAGACDFSIGDLVWNDANGNGIQDPGEPGIPGVYVYLLNGNGDFITEVQTDADGHYYFHDLCPGTYKVGTKPPDCPPTKTGGTSDTYLDSNPDPSEVTLIDQTDYSIDFGFVCKPVQECAVCNGKLTDLCLKYNGSVGANVFIGKSAKTFGFNGFANPGDVICVKGWEKDGTLGKSIKVKVNGKDAAKFIGECKDSKSKKHILNIGTTSGPFTVVSGTSAAGPLCEGPPPPPPGNDLCSTKPAGLMLMYTGEDCSASSNIQAPNKTSCSGDPAGASPVRIVVTNSSTAGSGKVYFDGLVALNDEFAMTAANAGDNKLSAESYAYIYSNGVLVQSIAFHTSCSQPLRRGDQFGSLVVTGIASPTVSGNKDAF